MGDVSSNLEPPGYHIDKDLNVLGIYAGGHHLGAGQPYVAPPELSLSAYAPIHAAALQSQTAFDAVVASSPWGPWYATVLPLDCRPAWRAGCALVPPRTKLPPAP